MLAYIVALVEIRDFQYHCDNARDDGKYYYYVKYIESDFVFAVVHLAPSLLSACTLYLEARAITDAIQISG